MATEKKTRNVPQLTKDVRKLNALKKKREKMAGLDAEIAAQSAVVANQLGLGPQNVENVTD